MQTQFKTFALKGLCHMSGTEPSRGELELCSGLEVVDPLIHSETDPAP